MNFNFNRTKTRWSVARIIASVAFVIGVGYIAGKLQKKGLKEAGKAFKAATVG